VAEIQALLKTRPRTHWLSVLGAARIPCGPINTLDRVFADPQVSHLGLVQEVEHPHYGKVKVVGPPATFSESEIGIQNPPPLLGEHNREILTHLLGYSDEEVESLRDQGVI